MNKLLLSVLFVLLPCSGLAASEDNGRSPRRMLGESSNGERLTAEGNQQTRRRLRRPPIVAGGGGSSSGFGTGGASTGESGSGGSGGGASKGGGSNLSQGFVSVFEPDSPRHGGPFLDNPTDRPRYSTPEPGAYGEMLAIAAGLAAWGFKRRRRAAR